MSELNSSKSPQTIFEAKIETLAEGIETLNSEIRSLRLKFAVLDGTPAASVSSGHTIASTFVAGSNAKVAQAGTSAMAKSLDDLQERLHASVCDLSNFRITHEI